MIDTARAGSVEIGRGGMIGWLSRRSAMRKFLGLGWFVITCLAATVAGQEVESLDPARAFGRLKTPSTFLVDVRSVAEYVLVGHPEAACLVPMTFWNESRAAFEPNENFIDDLKARFKPDDTLIFICRSGKRSLQAAEAARKAGFHKTAHVDQGFEGELDAAGRRTIGGWKNSRLPWTYQIDPKLTYQSPMDAGTAARTRYQGAVAVWYGSHFEDTALHDWVPIKDWNGPFHPVLGDYKTSDPDVVRQHLRWLRRAGADVIFYDLCRVQPELTILELPKQKTLQLIVDALSHQEKESRKLQLVLWMEKWNSNPTPEQYRFGLEYVRTRLAPHDFYYRFDGKPLVITYLNSASAEIDAIDREYEPLLTIRRLSPYAGVKGWKYFGPEGDKECMTVNPGANGFLEEGFITKYVDKKPVDEEALRRRGKAAVEQRADGRYFESQLLKARQVDPKLIFISGWNDWAWCLQIEPAKEYGFRYVDIAARLLGREAETRPYR